MKRYVAPLAMIALSSCKPAHHADIAPGAIVYMDAATWPKMLDRLGDTGFARANNLTAAAADAVAQDPECDRVTGIGVSDTSTPGDIRWFVDCENGYRARLSEHDFTSK